MRRTRSLLQVAMVMLEDPDGRYWGYQLSKSADVRSGVLYPILTRMLDEGWITDGWENPEEITGPKRPPRRYYELTDEGKAELAGVVRAAHAVASRSTQPRFA